MSHKENALQLIHQLENAGFPAYLVGGCIRDNLHNQAHLSNNLHPIEINDFDIVTAATLPEVVNLFEGKYPLDLVGKAFGIAIVNGIEVAQYRTETYEQTGKPTIMHTDKLSLDAMRRDFTVNALYEASNGTIYDFHDGVRDIKQRKIRAIGNPQERFEEHPIRILRAFYLAAKLDYTIDDVTARVIREQKTLLTQEPPELIGKMVMKAIDAKCFASFFDYLVEYDCIEYVFPSITHLKGLPQNSTYHLYDALKHTQEVVHRAELLRPRNVPFLLGAVYHDNGKGREGIRSTNAHGQPNDLGHEYAGVPYTLEDIVNHLHLGKKIATTASLFVKHHGDKGFYAKSEFKIYRYLRKLASDCGFTNRIQLKAFVRDLFVFISCDISAMHPSFARTIEIENIAARTRIENLFFTDYPLLLSELPIDGHDIVSLGITGKQVGELKQQCLESNLLTREQCLSFIRKTMKKSNLSLEP